MKEENWSSKLGFILSAAGSAIGLGNLWKFPFLAGQNGGGTFIVLYGVLMLLVGLPLLINDFVIGRFSKTPNVLNILNFNNKKTFLSKFSFIYIIINILILSYYFVVFGWTIHYTIESLTGALSFNHDLSKGYYLNFLNNFLQDSNKQILYTLIGIVATIAINFLGIVNGIEKASLVMLPILFIILIIISVKAVMLPGSKAGLDFYLSFDFKYITFKAIGIALGQVFFSLALGMATMMVYSSYLDKSYNLVTAASATTLMGFLVAAFSSLIIFPSTFALGYDITSGKGLVFVTFPAILAKLPFGQLFAILFFILLGLAAITTTVSMVETVIGAFKDTLKISRNKAIIIVATIIFLLSIPQELSLNYLQNLKIFSMNLFDITDYFSSVILLPIAALMSCIFTGYFLKKNAHSEFTNNGTINKAIVNTWFYSIKYILPVIIVIILIFGFIN